MFDRDTPASLPVENADAEISPATGSIAKTEIPSTRPAPIEPQRLTYVALRELPLEFPLDAAAAHSETEWPEATVDAGRDDPEWWAADVKPVAAPSPAAPSLTGPRIAPSPTHSLPWQGSPAVSVRHDQALMARLATIGPVATQRLQEKFRAAKVAWPPQDIVLIAIKDEKSLELFARPKGGAWAFVHRYPVLAASGGIGPKLRQGDKQVPEGIYSVSFLNPESRYHVSMRLNYPNAFDRKMAEQDGRKVLGGDIMIHGKNVSAGCLAMGDAAAEELFVLSAQTGLPNVKVIIAPTDLRRNDGVPGVQAGQPAWLPRLYSEVAVAMADYKKPNDGLLSFFKF